MITEQDFAAIDKEVQESLNAIFDYIRQHHPSDYVLLLADGEFKEEYLHTTPKYEPYVIDSREDFYIDETRVKFFVEFLKTFYTFPKGGTGSVEDSDIRQQMELMIYTHVWEAKPFLKRLYRMALLCNDGIYEWNVTVPPMGKHEFIRNEIRQRFENKGLNLFQVMKNGYHSSLRNAFAHSEYSFDEKERLIWLHNYSGTAWELKNISYDDWSRRFTYSVLLAYHLINITHDRRSKVAQDFGTDVFQINHPRGDGSILPVNIKYREQHNAFGFVS
jgi:hypothetical protein